MLAVVVPTALGTLAGTQALLGSAAVDLGTPGVLRATLAAAPYPTLLGPAVAPAWAAAALRGACRPDPDWSGPAVSTPMGVLPAGVGATLVQGVDVGVVGSLPLLAALLLGGPTPLLVAVQLAWSLLLAGAVLAQLGRRRTAG